MINKRENIYRMIWFHFPVSQTSYDNDMVNSFSSILSVATQTVKYHQKGTIWQSVAKLYETLVTRKGKNLLKAKDSNILSYSKYLLK